jgi:ribosomal protein S27AE
MVDSNLEGMIGFWSDASYNEPFTNSSLRINSGLGYAWYLMIICAILSIVGYDVLSKKSVLEPLITSIENGKKELAQEDEKNKELSFNTNFCPNCGVKIDGKPIFCFKCGFKLM